jgi:translation initiation factor IF-2
MADRLDMTAEMAVEKLRFMMFDVDNVDSEITDEECDLLIDVDDDDAVATRVRDEKLEKIEKDKKRNERLREGAKKAGAKRKAAAAKKKAATEKKKAAAAKKAAEEAEAAEEAPAAEIIDAPAIDDSEEDSPVAEIISSADPVEAPAEVVAETAEVEAPVEVEEEEEESKPDIIIGSAIDHDEENIHVLRADGTEIKPDEVEVVGDSTYALIEPAEEAEPEDKGIVAEAEREVEEEDIREQHSHRPVVKADPAVVAEVKRKAAERMQRLQTQRASEARQRGGTGKTARKRQKKAERQRTEDGKRRDAAAAVKGFSPGSMAGPMRTKKKRIRRSREEEPMEVEVVESGPNVSSIEVEDSTTVEQLADLMLIPVNDLILDLMNHDIMATKNHVLTLEIIQSLAEERGIEVSTAIAGEEEVLAEEPDDPADLISRAPVVTVMGHVDHGKTTLLDRIRAANVADGEAGGITQHIAAYDVPIGDGRVVFLDTPGHEAFTQMRARGAQATDVVVLVVAADDGIMPQTVEAIDHAKAAEVPIVVAVNKCDKPNAQPDRIRQELTQHELMEESWGGTTQIKDISAINGDGVTELLELLELESEMLELKANPNKAARGVVVESEISRGQGPVAWVLVQNGTLRVGDVFLAGTTYGRVRTMHNSRGESVEEAGPATPVVVTGFSDPPDAGDVFTVLAEERMARDIAESRSDRQKSKQGPAARHVTLEDFHEHVLAGDTSELRIVIKADVQGSVDVLKSSFERVGNQEVQTKVVHVGVGGINESDVLLASASDAVIIGFHVAANPKAQKLAESEGVDIHTYRVIYEAIEDVRKALEGMLKPEEKQVSTGHAEIRTIFRSSSFGNIAGCYVLDGNIDRGSMARLIRDDKILVESKIGTLRRIKDDARTVATGFECGIKLDKYEDIKEGDIIETYRIDTIAKTLT